MSPVTILVVDDNDLFRLELVSFLRKRGFTVSEARSGDDGLYLARKRTPDIVLTDLVMPNLDGIDEIKRLRIELPKTKIFAMSGGGRRKNVDLLSLAEKMGADAVFEKPLNMMAVVNAIEGTGRKPPVGATGAGSIDSKTA